jgi:acylphosphatase
MATYVATKMSPHHPARDSARFFSSIRSLMVCKKCLVGGRVQGVYYRHTAARRAQELGIGGYARNLPDGRVEVLACGEEQAVRAFVSWLWIGSSACKVTSVEVNDAVPDAGAASAGFRTS